MISFPDAKMDTHTDTAAAGEITSPNGVRPRVQETDSDYGDTTREGNETGEPEATRLESRRQRDWRAGGNETRPENT